MRGFIGVTWLEWVSSLVNSTLDKVLTLLASLVMNSSLFPCSKVNFKSTNKSILLHPMVKLSKSNVGSILTSKLNTSKMEAFYTTSLET